MNDERSLAYDFVLNMWRMKRVDEAFINLQVERNRLTADEAEMIIGTPQDE